MIREYRPGECQRCGCKRDTATLSYVRPLEEWERTQSRFGSVRLIVTSATSCVNSAACSARREKRYDRSRTRAQVLVLEQPTAPDAARGTCRWCGEPIVRADNGQPDRRRNYHYAKHGERDCVTEFNRSRTWDAREAIRRLAGDVIVCVDCRVTCEGPPIDGEFQAVPWEADHQVPLEDGGEHSIHNLRPRCVLCHTAKTAREATERARRRRPQQALAA